MRICTKCTTEKPLSDFGKKAQARDGVSPWCKKCVVLAGQKQYHAPGGAQKKRAYDIEYNIKNRDRIKARRVANYEKTKERRIAAAKIWAEKNPQAKKAISTNYKARRKEKVKSGMSTKELILWLNRQELICVWCGIDCQGNYHIDHVIPLSRGGLHEWTNLAIACPTCNLRKNAKLPMVFALEIEAEILNSSAV